MLQIYNDEIFASEVLDCEKPVIVDFWADWCSPCRMQAPILEEIDEDIGTEICIGKVNVDEAEELLTQYNIAAVPTMLFFKGGELREKLVGLSSRQEIEEVIDRVMEG